MLAVIDATRLEGISKGVSSKNQYLKALLQGKQ
jgi:hypothetical protein